MNKKFAIAATAAAILGLGAVAAEARPGHGGFGGPGGFGGRGPMPSFNSGPRGIGPGAFRSGPRIGGPRMGGPRMGRGPMMAGDWNGRRHGNWNGNWRHRGGRGFYVGLPYYSYYDYSYGGYGCGYLYNRAVRTGSPYWWARYEECVY